MLRMSARNSAVNLLVLCSVLALMILLSYSTANGVDTTEQQIRNFQQSTSTTNPKDYLAMIRTEAPNPPMFPNGVNVPDTMGAIGPTQFTVVINGRVRTFNKSTGQADSILNHSLDDFFATVRNGLSTFDPQVRYDRHSNRWFVLASARQRPYANTAGIVVLAISNSSQIRNSSDFAYYFFAPNSTCSPLSNYSFLDQPWIGIDKNAIYIGGSSVVDVVGLNQPNRSDAFVLVKSTVLGQAGNTNLTTITFPFCGVGNLLANQGMYGVRGVDNLDDNPTTGWFIAIDAQHVANTSNEYYKLFLRKITFDANNIPSISPTDIALDIGQTFASYKYIPQRDATSLQDYIFDDNPTRLAEATIRDGYLWTLHTIATNDLGASDLQCNNAGTNAGTGRPRKCRNSIRWYKINISNPNAPAIAASGVITDNQFANDDYNQNDPIYYYHASGMISGDGRFTVAMSGSNLTKEYPSTYFLLATNGHALVSYRQGNTMYKPTDIPQINTRWGDYSYTSLDPCDDMSEWTIQEFAQDVNNWGLQVRKIEGVPPIISVGTPIAVAPGASKYITLVGQRIYDTPPELTSQSPDVLNCPRKLKVSIAGVTTNGVNIDRNTIGQANQSITVNVSVPSNITSTTSIPIVLTNPDGQPSTNTVNFTIDPSLARLVTKVADTNDGVCSVSDCSLREAIATVPDGGAVNFAAGLSGTITLNPANGLLFIRKNMTINGSGSGVITVSGLNTGAVFEIRDDMFSQLINVNIAGLTIKNGLYGVWGQFAMVNMRDSKVTNNSSTGIVVYDAGLSGVTGLSLDNVEVSNNNGGGVSIVQLNTKISTINNSLIANNTATDNLSGTYPKTAGVYASGQVTITKTSIKDNTLNQGINSSVGSGILASGTFSMEDSILSGNKILPLGITSFGGGLYASDNTEIKLNRVQVNGNSASSGGGIAIGNSISIITNSTISGNSAVYGGGIFTINPSGNKPLLTAVTIKSNTATSGKNIYMYSGGVVLRGSIVMSDNTSGSNCYNFGPNSGVVDIDNLSRSQPQSDTSCNIAPPPSGLGPMVVTVPDLQLGTLQNNGGFTSTHALSSGSPARNVIPASTCIMWGLLTDQRGFKRPTGQPCDAGAFDLDATFPTAPDTIGVFRPSQSTFYLRNSNTSGAADKVLTLGTTTDFPVTGDWNGDGIDTVGVYRPSSGQFFLTDAQVAPLTVDYSFTLGIPNDTPIVGDWDGDGRDGVGIFRPSNGLLYLKNSLTSGFADYSMVLGIPGDVGIAGDWNGDGIYSPGVYRPSNQQFYLTNQVCNCSVFADYTIGLGIAGDVPFAGDWNGDRISGVGVFRPTNGMTYLRNDPTTSGFADLAFTYGIANDKPVAGRWLGFGGTLSILSSGEPIIPPTTVPELAPTFMPKQ